MSIHLHMLPPSVNNLAVRVFMRAAGIDFEESNAWGKTRSEEFMAKIPAHLTPAIEDGDHPRGAMWESCAIMMYLANKHQLDKLYPTDPGKRALVDNANFYLTGTLYPFLARATYPRLQFPCYPGEVAGTEGADEALQAKARSESESAALESLEVFNRYFIQDGFIGDGEHPSIADIRLAATLEFFAMHDAPLPDWAQAYRGRVEEALGEAYTGPAGDVRGFLASLEKSD